jgi:thiamine biosynthesis lipoprotein
MNQDEIRIPDDAELDFGGFGKGWLIDDLGRLLRDEGYDQFVINGGGDILVSSPSPIEFALEHPTDSTKKIGTTRISQGALAVSSSVKRAWKQGDKSYHHIIDPRLGGSSDSVIISTYVKADSALIADTMATLLLIAPEQDETLRQQFSLETILLNQRQLKS